MLTEHSNYEESNKWTAHHIYAVKPSVLGEPPAIERLFELGICVECLIKK